MERTFAYFLSMLLGALLAVLLFLSLFPWRRRRLKAVRLGSPVFREVVLAFFWAYCGAIAAIGLTPRWFIWSFLRFCDTGVFSAGAPFFSPGNINLIPFQTFGFSAHLLYNLLGNILLFLPFGLLTALLWREYCWKRALLTGVCITGFIECWQLLVGRTLDIDDLLLNTFGVLCGYWLSLILRRRYPAFTAKLQVN